MEETEYVVHDPRIDAMEVRLNTLETEQRRLTDLIKKLLQFHCSERTRSTEACMSMFA